VIDKQNFNTYFKLNTGIANCKQGIIPGASSTGCPAFSEAFIPSPGQIVWQGGHSLTFQTNEAVLWSGQGFVGFKLNSVPEGPTEWNSIWLIGKDQYESCTGNSCLEIDIYEMMNSGEGWWSSPKISLHDWKRGQDGGCFGLYLDGSLEGNTCTGKNIIKSASKWWPSNRDWRSSLYKGASWFTLITKQNGSVKVYVGINLSGWLPSSQADISVDTVKNNADFLVESPDNSIKGDTQGGFLLSLSSTAVPGKQPADGSRWDIPVITVIDAFGSIELLHI